MIVRRIPNIDYSKIITVVADKRGGQPCVRGLRIAVSDVLGYMAGGMAEDEVLREFPYLTREDIRHLVRVGLEQTRGNYKALVQLFNMEPQDYKRFLNFLRKHDCQLPFKEYRQ